MKRFKAGDLAITCNSRAPLINDGHLVTILEVMGPMPEWGLAFAYRIERVDGQPLLVMSDPEFPIPGKRSLWAHADQSRLRPLAEPPAATRKPAMEDIDA